MKRRRRSPRRQAHDFTVSGKATSHGSQQALRGLRGHRSVRHGLLDTRRVTENAVHEIELRWRAARKKLDERGADAEILAVMEASIGEDRGVPGQARARVGHRGGRPRPRPRAPATAATADRPVRALPHLMPLVALAGAFVPHVVVLADRIGAEARPRPRRARRGPRGSRQRLRHPQGEGRRLVAEGSINSPQNTWRRTPRFGMVGRQRHHRVSGSAGTTSEPARPSWWSLVMLATTTRRTDLDVPPTRTARPRCARSSTRSRPVEGGPWGTARRSREPPSPLLLSRRTNRARTEHLTLEEYGREPGTWRCRRRPGRDFVAALR